MLKSSQPSRRDTVCTVDTNVSLSRLTPEKLFCRLPQAHPAVLPYLSISPVNPEDFSVVLRARKRIEEGEEIAIHYVSPMQGLLKRKQSIEEEWYFKCRCKKKLIPKETLGLQVSTVL